MTEVQLVPGREVVVDRHIRDDILRAERLPHIWCPGCGIGVVLGCYTEAIKKSGMPLEKHVCVSGIGCTGRLAGYLNLDSYHTTHGRAIAFATGIAIVNPELEVTVISGDGDISTIGGNHLIHAARRNVDINVIMVNNFNYGMTGGQHGATTPIGSKTYTTPYGNIESPFNIPYLVAAAGASFVSRWTTLHVMQLTKAIKRMLEIEGFTFIEVISPCPPTFGEFNDFPDALDMMEYFRKNCVVDNDADLSKIGISLRPGEPLVVGDFIERRRPSYQELLRDLIKRASGGGEA